MGDYRPSFLGSVMKAIACTMNKNFDETAYHKGVIEPARRIRKLQEELGENPPGEEQMKEVMALLLGIFETKGVDSEEREERLREIIDRNHLSATFPEPAQLLASSQSMPLGEEPPQV